MAVDFHTFFEKLDLAVLDRLADYPGVQATITYAFWVLRDAATDWVKVDDLADYLFLPAVREEFPPSTLGSGFGHQHFVAHTRVVNPLVDFGLLETRVEKVKVEYGFSEERFVRKTALFDKFLRFQSTRV